MNEQLRKINLNLRQQARAGTVYAPGLMYAPTPTPMSGISIGSEDDGGNQGGAATLVGPRPEGPEDSQVGSYSSSSSSHLTFWLWLLLCLVSVSFHPALASVIGLMLWLVSLLYLSRITTFSLCPSGTALHMLLCCLACPPHLDCDQQC